MRSRTFFRIPVSFVRVFDAARRSSSYGVRSFRWPEDKPIRLFSRSVREV
jgi:hypothetical protein